MRGVFAAIIAGFVLWRLLRRKPMDSSQKTVTARRAEPIPTSPPEAELENPDPAPSGQPPAEPLRVVNGSASEETPTASAGSAMQAVASESEPDLRLPEAVEEQAPEQAEEEQASTPEAEPVEEDHPPEPEDEREHTQASNAEPEPAAPAPATHPEMPIFQITEDRVLSDYQTLLYDGIVPFATRALSRAEEELLPEWSGAIADAAENDRLRAKQFWLVEGGIYIASVQLLAPDGTPYDWPEDIIGSPPDFRAAGDVIRPQLERDWGNTIYAARARA